MNKQLLFIIIIGLSIMLLPVNSKAQDPISEVIKAGIIKAIKAVDLKIQRLQTETIWLQNAQKVVENTMAKVHLTEISGWAEKQRNLYADYFEELRKVKNIVSYYHRIREIMETQKNVVAAYSKAYALFKRDPHFTAREVAYMDNVYAGILDGSVKNLDQVFVIIHSFSTQMTDAARLQIIDRAADGIERSYSDLKAFNTENMMISLQRSRSQSETDLMKKVYGLN